ncbi:MAG TPA: hypothetical protein VGD69_04645 [Herpetosiphonaceae bacterium]
MIRPLPLRLSLGLFVLLTLVSGALLIGGRHPGQLRILVPVVPGDAALIMAPNGKTVLIDGGEDGAALATWLGNALPFGQRDLDVLILTRPDAKTILGQLAALKRYRVGMALMAATEENNSNQDAWWDLLAAQSVTPQPIAAGDQIKLGECTLDTLTEHEGRLTLALRCGATTAHFLQSIDDEAEQELEALDLESSELVVYPWKRGTNTPVMQALRPKAIVFSEGGRSEGALSWTDRQIGDARLFHEDVHGQVELRSTGEQLAITAERGE